MNWWIALLAVGLLANMVLTVLLLLAFSGTWKLANQNRAALLAMAEQADKQFSLVGRNIQSISKFLTTAFHLDDKEPVVPDSSLKN